MKRLLALALAALVLFAPLAARAATCIVSATGVGFGDYDPTSATPTPATGTVTVVCSAILPETVNYTIALSAGSGSFFGRTLTFGGSTLSYQHYTNATYSTVWGDGSDGSSTVSDGYSFFGTITRSYTVYGRIPAGQWPPAGVYIDSITVTITY